MIRNERQYRITKSEADKFDRAVSELEQSTEPGLHPVLLEAQRNALLSQLTDLRAQISDYETLRSGKHMLLELTSLAELPQSLVKARIASGLSQRELAEKLGLKEQQIQRYEATDYSGASLNRLMEVAHALRLNFQKSMFLPASSLAESEFSKRLKSMGFEQEFVQKRLLSRTAAASADPNDALFQTTAALSRILGLTPGALLGSQGASVDPSAYLAARFKVPAAASSTKLLAYTVYAHFLALLVLEATDVTQRPIPADWSAFRSDVCARFGSLSFSAVLQYAWHLGVPVLPLRDPGAFHAACWRVAGRNVIVLKQQTISTSRWLFDLLHELKHASEHPDRAEFEAIELPTHDVAAVGGHLLASELLANRFAGDVILAGRAEELATRAVEMTKTSSNDEGRLQFLKSAVVRLSGEEQVPVDALANYLAYRLAFQGENWWGAAMNLQSTDSDPWSVARELLVDRLNLQKLNPFDRQLLMQGLAG